MKSLKTHIKEKSYGPQDTGLSKDEWKSKLKQRHHDVEFTNTSDKDHEAHIPWGKDKRRVGVWTSREKGGPHHSMDFARLATKSEETQIDEISKKTLQSYTLKALDQSHAAQNKFITTPGKKGIEALKKSKKREAGIEKAERKIDKMSEEALDEVSTSTLKSYLKSNFKKTVEKDGQPNPPMFKLKARAKGMDTAISKLMKRESLEEAPVGPMHPAVKAMASMKHKEYKATVTFHDGTSKNISMKGTGGVKNAVSHIQNHYANQGAKVRDVNITSVKDKDPMREEAMKHSIGDQVRCNKTDRLATVTGVENDQYTVAYGDGSTQTGDASMWSPIRKANESKTFRALRIEAECRTPVEKDYYKAYRHLHFCKGQKGKSASSRSGGSFSSSNTTGEGSSGNGNGNGGNGGGDGGGGNGGGV